MNNQNIETTEEEIARQEARLHRIINTLPSQKELHREFKRHGRAEKKKIT